jgi:hypothetical protein
MISAEIWSRNPGWVLAGPVAMSHVEVADNLHDVTGDQNRAE